MPDQLDIEPFPYEIAHVWDWWLTLQASRPIGMQSGHITYSEICSWSTLLKINPTPFEVRCIMALDSLYLAVGKEQQDRKAPSGKK